MPKVAVLLQVRMKSTRLPRKAMLTIEDKSLMEHVIDRLKAAKTTYDIIICTSTHQDDRILLELAERTGIKGFAGNEEDVLDRFIQAANREKADVIIRVTGERPLVSLVHLDRMVEHHIKTNTDYTATKQLPAGVAVEVISTSALEKAYQLADNPELSEYMTLYFREDFFRTEIIEVEESLRRPYYRLTVDTPEDLELVREVYRRLYKPDKIIALEEVVRLLDENPELPRINMHRVPKKVDREVINRGGHPKIRIIIGE